MLPRRANAVATAVIVLALVIAAAVMMRQSTYVTPASHLQDAFENFDQQIYSSPYELLGRYAAQGYEQNSTGLWYCGAYPSGPNLSATRSEFPLFAQNDLRVRLATLAEQLPGVAINISGPEVSLDAANSLENLPNDTALVNISELSVTFTENGRSVTKDLSQVAAYDTRFWRIYKEFQDWSRCSEDSIYQNGLKDVFIQKSCSFFKDMCVCLSDSVGKPPPPGCPFCNSPPTENDEVREDGHKLQDFTQEERNALINQFGSTEGDLQAASDRVASDLTSYFKGEKSCTAPKLPSDSGIRCVAQLEKTNTKDDFYSSLAFHNTGCVVQTPPTCGITTISEFDFLNCVGQLGKGLQIAGGPGGRSELQAFIQALAAGDSSYHVCSYVPPHYDPDPTKNFAGGYVCNTYYISQQTLNFPSSCKLLLTDQSLIIGTKGTSGTWQEKIAEDNAGLDCHNRITDASSPAVVSNAFYMHGDDTVKLIKETWKATEGPWFGSNGWIDRKGSFDIAVTCTDSGGNGIRPLSATIKMHVLYRYGCSQASRMIGCAPPACAAPGVAGEPPCHGPQDCGSTTCDPKICDQSNPDNIHCADAPKPPDGTECTVVGDPCFGGACSAGSCEKDPSNIKTGNQCGSGESQYCNHCEAITGACVSNDEHIGQLCENVPSSNPCREKVCMRVGTAGECDWKNIEGTCKGDFGCATGCTCTNGEPDYEGAKECGAQRLQDASCAWGYHPMVCTPNGQGKAPECKLDPPVVKADYCCGTAPGVCDQEHQTSMCDHACCPSDAEANKCACASSCGSGAGNT